MCFFFSFNDTAPPEIYTLSLHDALPISGETPSPEMVAGSEDTGAVSVRAAVVCLASVFVGLVALIALDNRLSLLRMTRSEEHTSELQSHSDLVCRLLLEKKKQKQYEMFR